MRMGPTEIRLLRLCDAEFFEQFSTIGFIGGDTLRIVDAIAVQQLSLLKIILLSIILLSIIFNDANHEPRRRGAMAAFIDRIEDLNTLEDQFHQEEPSLVVIYGRRRVGKTALITEFMKDKRGLYFLATEESEAQNMTAFRQKVAQFTHDDVLAAADVGSWDVLFDRLTEDEGKLVIALDEFQYLGKANTAFPSVFQRIWDTILSKRNVMVILCGSLISLMVSQTLNYDSPLYGRRTAQIHLRQVPFSFYREFFTHPFTRRQLVERYSVTGGVPKYIELFRGSDDIYKAIRKNVLDTNSFLFDEPNFLLSKEVSEVGTYFSVIKAIAAGNRKGGNIASAMGVKQTSLGKYLHTLEGLDMVERVVPVTETNPQKSKKGIYRIKDNYLRFWFRFVFPNLGLLETRHVDEVMALVRRNLIDGHTAFVYEDICRENVWGLAADQELPFIPARVGAWWGAGDQEIDVVAVSEAEERAAFGECKMWKHEVGGNVLKELEAKSAAALKDKTFARYREKPPVYMLFSLSGFTDALRRTAEDRDDVILCE